MVPDAHPFSIEQVAGHTAAEHSQVGRTSSRQGQQFAGVERKLCAPKKTSGPVFTDLATDQELGVVGLCR